MAMSDVNAPVVLITGSEGLIGHALVNALSPRYRVVSMDVVPAAERSGTGDYLQADLTRDDSVQASIAGLKRLTNRVASVVHLAAYYDFSGEPSPLYKSLTIEGTGRLLRELRTLEVEQFIFASTHILMKPAEKGESVTETSPVEPTWEYPKSKLETEQLIQREHGQIPAVILRIAGVYNEDCHTVSIAQQIDRIANREFESYLFPGDPESGQAYIHLDDLVDCIGKVIERRKRLSRYEVFLVAELEKISYKELQEEIGELIHGREWPTIRVPKLIAKAGAWVQEKIEGEDETFIKPWMIDRADDDYPVSIEHARERLDWIPRRKLRDTLPQMIDRLREDPARWLAMNKLKRSPDELREALRHAAGRGTQTVFDRN
jgi:nucleoside-diphosphate-sugar epimerase